MLKLKFFPQAFISSTRDDLLAERNMASGICLSQKVMPMGMELFAAADQERWEFIKDAIDPCDFMILILGGRYGSINEEPGPYQGLSFTHSEFRYAISRKIPVFRFIKRMTDGDILDANNDAPDRFDAAKKMINFRKEVSEKVSAYWTHDTNLILSGQTAALSPQLTTVIGNQRHILYREYLFQQDNLVEKLELEKSRQKIADILRESQDITVHSTSNDFDHNSLIQNSKSVRIIMNDGFRFFEKYGPAFERRAAQNAQTEICLMAPEGTHISELAKRSEKSIDEQTKDIHKSRNFLKNTFSDSKNFSLYGMIGHFSYCLFQYDEKIIISLYMNFKREEELPLFLFTRTSFSSDIYYTLLKNTDRLFRAAAAGSPNWFVNL